MCGNTSSTATTTGLELKGSCAIHPEYVPIEPPRGFPCAACELAWITAEADRYDLLEAVFRTARFDG